MNQTPFDDEIRLLLEDRVGKRVRLEGLQGFILRMSPQLKACRHLDPLLKALEYSPKKEKRILVSYPPRHGKTTTISHAFGHYMTKDPTKTHAYVTYSGDLTKSKSRQIRRIAVDAKVQLAKGSKSLNEWRTVEGGGMLATSIGGSLTGQGITGTMVVDDPFKGREDADSPAQREKVWEWFTDVAYTRLEPGSSCIVVATRWNEDDLIGRLEKEFPNDWKVINVPAIDEEGNALWPEMYPLEKLEEIRGILGDYSFESLYQGRPRPRGANIFKDPARYLLPTTDGEWIRFMEGKYLIISVDPAATAKTSADYSVALVLAKDSLGPEGKGWVLDVSRAQTTVPAFVDVIRGKWEKWRCKIAVEAVGGFKAVPQMLEQIDPSLKVGKTIIEIHPTRDKHLRAQAVAAAWNSGRVMIPVNAPWTQLFLDEVLGFTGLGQRYDDQVDALAHAWNTLSTMKTRRRGYRFADGPFG